MRQPSTTTTTTDKLILLKTTRISQTTAATSTTRTANDEDDDYNDDEADIKFTPDEAIELFQTNLIEKERNVGGILNATAPFYRHFNLLYKSSAISVRCLYKSNCEKKTLNIKSTQYFETIITPVYKKNG